MAYMMHNLSRYHCNGYNVQQSKPCDKSFPNPEKLHEHYVKYHLPNPGMDQQLIYRCMICAAKGRFCATCCAQGSCKDHKEPFTVRKHAIRHFKTAHREFYADFEGEYTTFSIHVFVYVKSLKRPNIDGLRSKMLQQP